MSSLTTNDRVFYAHSAKIVGNRNKIHGDHCVVAGENNSIHGCDAFITGNYNRVYGQNCRVIGKYNDVLGDNALVEGNRNRVTADGCLIFGNHNVVRGTDCTVEGYDNTDRNALPDSKNSREPATILQPPVTRTQQKQQNSPLSMCLHPMRRSAVSPVSRINHERPSRSNVEESSRELLALLERSTISASRFTARKTTEQKMLESKVDVLSKEVTRLQELLTQDDGAECKGHQPGQCVICLDQRASVAFLDCKHLCLCSECDSSYGAGKCPVCRKYGGRTKMFLT